MTRALIFLVTFTVCSGLTHSQTLQSILTEYHKAIGGAEKLLAFQSVIVRAKSQGGGGGQKRPMTFTIKLPDKARLDYAFQPGLTYIQAFDGTSGWTVQPWTGSLDPQPLNEDNAKDAKRIAKMVHNDLITNGKDGTKLDYKGKDEIEGSEVYKIEAIRKDGTAITYFLDADSYLIVKTTTKYTESGVLVESDMFPSDYKTVNGLTLPYTIETKTNGEVNGANYIEVYDFTTKVEDAFFTMPAKKQ
jgi:hypothetical protein